MWDASPSQIRKEALKLGDAREGKLTLLFVGLIIATSRTMTGNEAGIHLCRIRKEDIKTTRLDK